MSLHILYLLPDPGISLSQSHKGASIHARATLHAMLRDGHHVTVLSPRFKKQQLHFLGRYLEIHKPPSTRITRLFRRHFIQQNNTPAKTALHHYLLQRDMFTFAKKMIQKTQKPDLLYAREAWFAHAIHRLKKTCSIPLILEINAVPSHEKELNNQAAFSPLARNIERKNLLAADLTVTVSEPLQKQLVEMGADPSHTQVLQNGVDLAPFQEALQTTDAFPQLQGRFVVGMVSSLKPHHGIDTLIRAAAQLQKKIPNLCVWIIGAGADQPFYQEQVAREGLQKTVLFEGPVAHHLLPLHIARFDLAAAPFQGKTKTYMSPLKIFEYMAAARPIICSRWGPLPEILEENTQALFHEPGNHKSLAQAIHTLYNQPDRAKQMGKQAAKLAARNSWTAILRQSLQTLEKLKALPQGTTTPVPNEKLQQEERDARTQAWQHFIQQQHNRSHT